MSINNQQGGFIKIILIILVIVVIISVLGFDLRGVVESQTFQNNLDAVFTVSAKIFNFIEPAVLFIWEDVLQPYIFEPIKGYLSSKTPQATETATSTP